MNIVNEQFEDLKYAINYPNCYKEGENFPVIIYLHGAGTRGDNMNVLINNACFQETDKFENFPFVTVAPLCSHNSWFDMFEQLKRFVLKIADEPYTDKQRIYLMGASMGGYATWQLAMSMPEVFSAIVPVCGGGMYWNAARLVNLPIWAFHGGKDDVVFKEESIKMVDAVNKNGGNAKLTLYPENGHNAWSDTYSNPKVFEWMLAHTNKNNEEITDKFNDSKIYG